MKSTRHIPTFQFDDAEAFWDHIPRECTPISLEITEEADSLVNFQHPQRAVYILGPEDGSVPNHIMERCHNIIRIPTKNCLNLGTTSGIVLYDRLRKSLDKSSSEDE